MTKDIISEINMNPDITEFAEIKSFNGMSLGADNIASRGYGHVYEIIAENFTDVSRHIQWLPQDDSKERTIFTDLRNSATILQTRIDKIGNHKIKVNVLGYTPNMNDGTVEFQGEVELWVDGKQEGKTKKLKQPEHGDGVLTSTQQFIGAATFALPDLVRVNAILKIRTSYYFYPTNKMQGMMMPMPYSTLHFIHLKRNLLME